MDPQPAPSPAPLLRSQSLSVPGAARPGLRRQRPSALAGSRSPNAGSTLSPHRSGPIVRSPRTHRVTLLSQFSPKSSAQSPTQRPAKFPSPPKPIVPSRPKAGLAGERRRGRIAGTLRFGLEALIPAQIQEADLSSPAANIPMTPRITLAPGADPIADRQPSQAFLSAAFRRLSVSSQTAMSQLPHKSFADVGESVSRRLSDVSVQSFSREPHVRRTSLLRRQLRQSQELIRRVSKGQASVCSNFSFDSDGSTNESSDAESCGREEEQHAADLATLMDLRDRLAHQTAVKEGSKDVAPQAVPTAAAAKANEDLKHAWRVADAGHKSQKLHLPSPVHGQTIKARLRALAALSAGAHRLFSTHSASQPQPLVKAEPPNTRRGNHFARHLLTSPLSPAASVARRMAERAQSPRSARGSVSSTADSRSDLSSDLSDATSSASESSASAQRSPRGRAERRHRSAASSPRSASASPRQSVAQSRKSASPESRPPSLAWFQKPPDWGFLFSTEPARDRNGVWDFRRKHRWELQRQASLLRKGGAQDASEKRALARAEAQKAARRHVVASLKSKRRSMRRAQAKKHRDMEERLQKHRDWYDVWRRSVAWATVVGVVVFPVQRFRSWRTWTERMDVYRCARAYRTMERECVPAWRRYTKRKLLRRLVAVFLVSVLCARVRQKRVVWHADRVRTFLQRFASDGILALRRFRVLVRKGQQLAKQLLAVRRAQAKLLERWYIGVETQLLLRNPALAIDPNNEEDGKEAVEVAKAHSSRLQRFALLLPLKLSRAVSSLPFRKTLPAVASFRHQYNPPSRRPLHDYVVVEARQKVARRRWGKVREYVFSRMREQLRLAKVRRTAAKEAEEKRTRRRRKRLQRDGPTAISSLASTPESPPTSPNAAPPAAHHYHPPAALAVQAVLRLRSSLPQAAQVRPPPSDSPKRKLKKPPAPPRMQQQQTDEVLPAAVAALRTPPELRRHLVRRLLTRCLDDLRRQFGRQRLEYWIRLRMQAGDEAGRLPWERGVGSEIEWRKLLLDHPPPPAPRLQLLRRVTDSQLERVVKQGLQESMLRRVLANSGVPLPVGQRLAPPPDSAAPTPSFKEGWIGLGADPESPRRSPRAGAEGQFDAEAAKRKFGEHAGSLSKSALTFVSRAKQVATLTNLAQEAREGARDADGRRRKEK